MTKEQFMMELEQSLQGEVSAYELSDSLTYYRQYFEDEIRNGKSEEDVIRELGSPRLIARSIIDAHGNEGAANSGYEDSDYREGSYSNYGSSYDSERGDIESSGQRGSGTLQNAGRMIMTIIISALIFFVVLFLLRALLPVAVVIIAIVFIVRLIRG